MKTNTPLGLPIKATLEDTARKREKGTILPNCENCGQGFLMPVDYSGYTIGYECDTCGIYIEVEHKIGG